MIVVEIVLIFNLCGDRSGISCLGWCLCRVRGLFFFLIKLFVVFFNSFSFRGFIVDCVLVCVGEEKWIGDSLFRR